jgi:hypothetical protein
MVMHKGSGLATKKRTALRRAANNDRIVTNVPRKRRKRTWIINVYNQMNVQTAES